MIPKPVQAHVRAAWDALDPKPTGYRHIDPQQWHVTFVFLGEVPEIRLDEITRIIEGWVSQAEPITFTADGFISFPPTDHRYLAAHLDSANMEKVAASIEDLRVRLTEIVPTLDSKPWLPHISIQKAFRDAMLFSWKQSMPSIEWNPEELVLAKSAPGNVGSTYTVLRRFNLPRSS